MRLIENTNRDNFQAFIQCNKSPEANQTNSRSTLMSKLILSNVIHRFLQDLKRNNVSPEAYESKVAPKLTIKVMRLSPESSDKEVYISNLNQPGDLNKPDNSEVNPKISELFNKVGINLPSDRVLSSRLTDINYSSQDPIRLEDVNYTLMSEINLTEMSYEELERQSNYFIEKSYSANQSPSQLGTLEQCRSIYLLSIIKNVDKRNWGNISQSQIEGICESLTDDRGVRQGVMAYLSLFVHSNPVKRDTMIKESREFLETNSEKEIKAQSNKPPMKLWKVMLIASLAIATTLAIIHRKAIKGSWELAGEYSTETPSASKFGTFFKLLASKKGRFQSREFLSGRKNVREGNSILEGEEVRRATANLLKRTGELAMKRSKNYLNGKI